MGKFLKVMMTDNVKFEVTVSIPTKIDSRVVREHQKHINIVDLSRRNDIQSLELRILLKPDSKPIAKGEKNEIEHIEPPSSEFLEQQVSSKPPKKPWHQKMQNLFRGNMRETQEKV